MFALRSASGSLACGRLRPLPALRQDGSVQRRVEEPPLAARRARAWASVEVDERSPIPVAAALPVHLVAVADVEQAAVVWLRGGEHLSGRFGPSHACAIATRSASAGCVPRRSCTQLGGSGSPSDVSEPDHRPLDRVGVA